MATLEARVNRVLFVAHLAERALHHPGPWAIQVGESSFPATRTADEQQIVFEALVPARPGGAVDAALLCAGRPCSWRTIEPPAEREFRFRWEISLDADAVAV